MIVIWPRGETPPCFKGKYLSCNDREVNDYVLCDVTVDVRPVEYRLPIHYVRFLSDVMYGNSPGRQLVSKRWKVLNTISLCYVWCHTAQTYDIITKVCGPLFTLHVTNKIPYRGVNEWPPERRWRVKRRRGRGDGASCLVGVCPHGNPLRGRQLATNNSSPPFLEDSANTATRLTTLPGDCKRGVVEPTVELYVIF